MNTQENNKMIAEFMGHKIDWGFKKDCILYMPTGEGTATNNSMVIPLEKLKYNTSWAWLMPVVEKIESLGYEFFIVENRVKVAHNTDHSIETIIDFTFDGGKKGATYRGVVEFINQYNKNK